MPTPKKDRRCCLFIGRPMNANSSGSSDSGRQLRAIPRRLPASSSERELESEGELPTSVRPRHQLTPRASSGRHRRASLPWIPDSTPEPDSESELHTFGPLPCMPNEVQSDFPHHPPLVPDERGLIPPIKVTFSEVFSLKSQDGITFAVVKGPIVAYLPQHPNFEAFIPSNLFEKTVAIRLEYLERCGVSVEGKLDAEIDHLKLKSVSVRWVGTKEQEQTNIMFPGSQKIISPHRWRQLNALGNPEGSFDSPFSSPTKRGASNPMFLTPKLGLGRVAPAEWLLDVVDPETHICKTLKEPPAPASTPIRRHLKGTRHPRKHMVGGWSYISADRRPNEQPKAASIITFESSKPNPGQQGISMVDLLYDQFDMVAEGDTVLAGRQIMEFYIRFEVCGTMVAYSRRHKSNDFSVKRSDLARLISYMVAKYCELMGIQDHFYNLRLTGLQNLIDDVWMPAIVVIDENGEGASGSSK